jgi:hypothetical protein
MTASVRPARGDGRMMARLYFDPSLRFQSA